MKKRGVSFGLELVITLIIGFIVVIIFGSINNDAIASWVKSNSCGGNALTKCMKPEACLAGTGTTIKGKNEDCGDGEICCLIRHGDITPEDLESPNNNNTQQGAGNQNNTNIGPVHFVVEKDGEEIPYAGTMLTEGVEYEFRVYATGEHVNLCRNSILYDIDHYPSGQPRTIYVTSLFPCEQGTSFQFTPNATHESYQPLEMDFVAFAQDYTGQQTLSDAQGTNSWKYYLQIEENQGQQGGQSSGEECNDIPKDECHDEQYDCYIKKIWFIFADQCRDCDEISTCDDYNNKDACNDNPCGFSVQGLKCAWTTYSGGDCNICANPPNTNSCSHYLDSDTCKQNPCSYGSEGCVWFASSCVEAENIV